MSKPVEQPSAFPTDYILPENRGLTKRELFAAMAMQGLLANSNLVGPLDDSDNPSAYDRKLALEAVISADALLAELAMDTQVRSEGSNRISGEGEK